MIEIVTEPDFSSSEQVLLWLKNLVHSLSYIKALRKNAGIKVDVNVSTYGERVEMKNLNSLEFLFALKLGRIGQTFFWMSNLQETE